MKRHLALLCALSVLSCDASKKDYDECKRLHEEKKLDDAELACMKARGKTDDPTTKYGKLAKSELEFVRRDRDTERYDAAVSKLQAEAASGDVSVQLHAQQKLQSRAQCESATHARCFSVVGVSAMSDQYSKP